MWGCLAKVIVPAPKRTKIGPKTVDCVFIGYAHNSNAYRFLVHDSKVSDVHKNMIFESKDASFFEDIFPCKPDESGPSRQIDKSMDENHVESGHDV